MSVLGLSSKCGVCCAQTKDQSCQFLEPTISLGDAYTVQDTWVKSVRSLDVSLTSTSTLLPEMDSEKIISQIHECFLSKYRIREALL